MLSYKDNSLDGINLLSLFFALQRHPDQKLIWTLILAISSARNQINLITDMSTMTKWSVFIFNLQFQNNMNLHFVMIFCINWNLSFVTLLWNLKSIFNRKFKCEIINISYLKICKSILFWLIQKLDSKVSTCQQPVRVRMCWELTYWVVFGGSIWWTPCISVYQNYNNSINCKQ